MFYWDNIYRGGNGFIKKSEFYLGRNKYTNFLKRKRKYLEKKKRLYGLLKEPLIKEYLELSMFLSVHTDEEFDENLLSIKAFDKLAQKTEQSCGIYLYTGEEKNENKVFLVNIETKKKIAVAYDSFETLKQHDHIIVIENENNEEDFYDKKLLEIRNAYLSSLKDLSQEAANEKIKREYNHKSKDEKVKQKLGENYEKKKY